MEINLSLLGKEIEKATVTFWFVRESEAVKKGQELVEVTTDKSVFSISAPVDATVTSILAPEGTEIGQTTPLCILDTTRSFA